LIIANKYPINIGYEKNLKIGHSVGTKNEEIVE
jgi:hypothetical protein